jgi:5-methylcytosine-specific restriction enzyme A
LGSRVPVMAPDSWRAGKTTDERGYTRRWKKARASWLNDHPLCGDRATGASGQHSLCAREQRVTAGSVVDHIEPHRGDQALFWNPLNWQTLCKVCHDVKTGAGG